MGHFRFRSWRAIDDQARAKNSDPRTRQAHAASGNGGQWREMVSRLSARPEVVAHVIRGGAGRANGRRPSVHLLTSGN